MQLWHFPRSTFRVYQLTRILFVKPESESCIISPDSAQHTVLNLRLHLSGRRYGIAIPGEGKNTQSLNQPTPKKSEICAKDDRKCS